MKTSIYLLAVLLIPTASHSYIYNRTLTGLRLTVTSNGNISVLAHQTSGSPGPLTSKQKLPTTDIKEGAEVHASAAIPITDFHQVLTAETGKQVRLELPGSDNVSRSLFRWELFTGQQLQRPNKILWSGDIMNSDPYLIASCDVPTTITNSDFINDYRPSFTTAVRFTDPQTGGTFVLDFDCYAVYTATADVSIQLDEETINLNGPAGTQQNRESSIRVTADPGRVRITFQNRNQNALVVSFEKDKQKSQTTLNFSSTGEQTVPFYVTTIDTTAGVRSYTVNVDATFI
ncbi:hypothetical protein QUQ56_004742 [Escherichia coli]|nr:hypothetical protein [Escherichia coli]